MRFASTDMKLASIDTPAMPCSRPRSHLHASRTSSRAFSSANGALRSSRSGAGIALPLGRYHVSSYYGVEQWLVKWAPDGWRSTWENRDTLLDLAEEREEEWVMRRAAEVKARDAQ